MNLIDEEICQMCCGDNFCSEDNRATCFEFYLANAKKVLNRYIQEFIDRDDADIDKDVHKQIEDLLDKRKVNRNIYECGMFDMGKCPSNRCSNCLADMVVDIVKKSGYMKPQTGGGSLIDAVTQDNCSLDNKQICSDKDCPLLCGVMLGNDPCPHRLPHICEGKLADNKRILSQPCPDGMDCPPCIPYK